MSSHDVACVGPARVDLILEGLEALPVHAELAHAARSEIAPGGSCNVAIACSRLGLRSVLVAPVCQDDLGSMLTARLAGAGVDWVGPPGMRTPVSVALASSGERAFVQSGDPRPVLAGDVALLGPRAVIGDVEGIPAGPDAPRMYATCDTVGAHQAAGQARAPDRRSRHADRQRGRGGADHGSERPRGGRGDPRAARRRRRSSRSAPTARSPRAAASWRTPRPRDSRRGR